ncbi:MAG: enhanced serine sensitivity protein SseB C-terminal domain-containing protein [Oscillibacter sp.]|nr:enhanced serine sensitivity protein SseB C-terminal domain-containing protein [Oscillibacter sp.]MEA4994641.1 enhanced serine sensitivity protein SseB C-terminal domain-containing protein [Oscillibacter sp.]MEA5040794.1 enhanced serine sensitivity protein SseB C-terminal domain-containing protein [Clostridiaceae bacterium]
MDINNTNLLNAIRLMKADFSKEPQFFAALHEAKFLCPVRVDTRSLPKNPDGNAILNSDSPISLVSISDSSGVLYLMAFTDRNELSKWNQGSYQQTIVYSFVDYKAVLTSGHTPYQGVVLNPFGDNIVLGKEIFKGGNDPFQTAKSNESIMIGQPKDYPSRMVEKLERYFRSNRLVDTAYLLWMVRGQEAGYLLVLGTKASPQQLFSSIGELCKPYLNEKPLDMVLLNTTFGQSAVQDQQPFYRA